MSHELPDGWSAVPLGSLLDGIETGSSFKCDERPPTEHETGVLKISAVTWGEYDESESKTCLDPARIDERALVQEGDFLLSRANTIELVGAAVIAKSVTRRLMLSDKILRLRFRAGVLPEWALRYLRTPEGRRQLEEASTGNQLSMRNIPQERLRGISIPLAPLNEQRRIVAKLEDLLARSRRAKEALDAIPPRLETLRRSILAAAFRGDLTADWRAKQPDVEPADRLVARIPAPEGKATGRSAAVDVRPGRCAISVGEPELPLPEGWQWVALSRIARMESGHTPSRAVEGYWNGDVSWISIPDARDSNGHVIERTTSTITRDGLANSAARLLPPGTVCLVRTAASIGYVTIMASEMSTSQDFANWVCGPALLPKYLMYALLAERESLRAWGEGSAHPTIYFPELKAFHICLAPLEEQQKIVEIIEARLGTLERSRQRAQELLARQSELSPALLSKAFRGELVPQDPTDEPADAMLARLRAATTDAAERPSSVRKKRGKKSAA